eukprot:m51a1_g1114 putative myotubularin-related protein 1 isoform x1 (1550) ;mRNA; f:151368-156862
MEPAVLDRLSHGPATAHELLRDVPSCGAVLDDLVSRGVLCRRAVPVPAPSGSSTDAADALRLYWRSETEEAPARPPASTANETPKRPAGPVRRFRSPLAASPYSLKSSRLSAEDAEALLARTNSKIEAAKKEIADLRSKLSKTQALAEGGHLAELRVKWLGAAQRALQEIQDHPRVRGPDGERVPLAQIIAAFRVQPEYVGYDVDDEQFVTAPAANDNDPAAAALQEVHALMVAQGPGSLDAASLRALLARLGPGVLRAVARMRDGRVCSLVQMAVAARREDVLRVLLECGADPNAAAVPGGLLQPLAIVTQNMPGAETGASGAAARAKCHALARLLVEFGARVDVATERRWHCMVRRGRGTGTPLWAAVVCEDLELAEMLLDKAGADPNLYYSDNGAGAGSETPMDAAQFIADAATRAKFTRLLERHGGRRSVVHDPAEAVRVARLRVEAFLGGCHGRLGGDSPLAGTVDSDVAARICMLVMPRAVEETLTTVLNVIVLLAHQHPDVISPALIPTSGCHDDPRAVLLWLERAEAIGTYAISDDDRLVVDANAPQTTLDVASPRRVASHPPHALCRVVVPAPRLASGSPDQTLLAALEQSHPHLRDVTSRHVRTISDDDDAPVTPRKYGPDAEDEEERGWICVRARACGSAQSCDCRWAASDPARRALDSSFACGAEGGEVEAIVWPQGSPFIPAPTWRVRVVVPLLRLFKTIVFSEHVTVEDVVIGLWEDAKVHHDHGDVCIRHWTQWELRSPAGTPLEPQRYMVDAASACVSREWWQESFVFAQLPHSTPSARVYRSPVPYSPDPQTAATGAVLCTVLLSHKVSYAVLSVDSSTSVSALLRAVQESAAIPEDAAATLLVLRREQSSWVLSAMDAGRCVGEYGGPVLSLEYREPCRARSLTIVTGVHYTVGAVVIRTDDMPMSPVRRVLRPHKKLRHDQESAGPRGVLLCGPTTTVRTALDGITSFLGMDPREYRLMMPEVMCVVKSCSGEDQLRALPSASKRAYTRVAGEPARHMWTYLLRPGDDVVVDPVPGRGSRRLALLAGESVIKTYSDVVRGAYSGTLYVTNYRLLFVHVQSAEDYVDDVEIPAAAIAALDVQATGMSLRIVVKDIRVEEFLMPAGVVRELADAIGIGRGYVPTRPTDCFAFACGPQGSQSPWSPYDPRAEFARQHYNPLQWRISEANASYGLCDTYPAALVVPFATTDADLAKMAEFRARRRVPAVCWVHPTNGATISRCSQPTAGLSVLSRRCAEDERFFQLLIRNSRKAERMVFVDLRGEMSVAGNALMGGGTENTSNYPNCTSVFLDLGNMHAMRSSFEKLSALCLAQSPSESGWLRMLDGTGWMEHLQKMLRGAVRLSDLVVRGIPVMAHCSDGWDRTPKVIALAELLLDPYYRTLVGFEVLVEKEWMSFGHQFESRVGIGKAPDSDRNISPIFIMFLDSVWQIHQQFPAAFQFSESLLVFLADCYYNGRFGTFLFNCELDRARAGAQRLTRSAWQHVADNACEFTNAAYTVGTDAVLIPSTSLAVLRLWASYYMRYNDKVIAVGDP